MERNSNGSGSGSYPVTLRSCSSSTSGDLNGNGKPGFRKFTKSLTLFIPSYEDEATADAASPSCTTTATPNHPLSSSTVGSNSLHHLPISSPDSAFHTGSEFNTTEDSFDPNSQATRNDKVERWVKTTANAAAAHAHMDPHALGHSLAHAHAHSHMTLPISSDDYEDILSVGSLCSSIRPGKIVIEESVEEIITHSNSLEESDPENASSDPELNPDSEETEEEDEFGSGSLVDGALDGEISTHPPLTWEYNWLFKKKKFIIGRGKNATQKFRTTMFIPNPMNYEEASCQYFPNEEELEENEDLSLESRETDETESEDELESEAEDEEVKVQEKLQRKPNFDRKSSLDLQIQKQKQNQPIPKQKVKPVLPDVAKTRQIEPISPISPEPESIEETMRETSRSLIASNDTIEYQSPSLNQPKPAEVKGTPSSITSENKIVPEKIAEVTTAEVTKVKVTNRGDNEGVLFEEIPEDSPPYTPTPSTLAEMRIAEREKQKWNNPVKISNNPYSPESLLRRISNNSFLQCNEKLGGKIIDRDDVDLEEPDPADFRSSTHDLSSNQKILRDYYVNLGDNEKSRTSTTVTNGSNLHGHHKVKVSPTRTMAARNQPRTLERTTEKVTQKPKAKVNPLVTYSNATSSQKMEPLQLPSVRNLAEKFRTDELSTPITPPPQVISDHKPRPLPRKTFDSNACAMKQIHSLTARSVPKQFREGLRLAKPPMSNVNIKSSTNI